MRTFFLDLIEERSSGTAASLLRGILRVLSFFYSWGVSLWIFLYQKGILSVRKLTVPVISVGNLTWGGTGKTPFVLELAREVLALGKKPLIVLRGYGEDEWKFLQAALPQAKVAVGRKRAETAAKELAKEKYDLVICDDAFQHWAIYRDWDIVLLNAEKPFGNGHVIPRGSLRESKQALKRARTFVATNTQWSSRDKILGLKKEILSFQPSVEWIETVHEPVVFYRASDREETSLESLRGRGVVLLSGIGSPELFEKTIQDLGLEAIKVFHFPDHHSFSEKELDEVCGFLEKHSVETVITTEKDYFRAPELLVAKLDPWVLQMKLRVTEGQSLLSSRLRGLLEKRTEEEIYA